MPSESANAGTARTAVIDFEASALGPDSYPIEVAWGWVDTFEIESHLIRPTELWLELGRWDAFAESDIHKISRAELLERGKPVDIVAERMVTALSGHGVYSDAPYFDGEWLEVLFRAAERPLPMVIESIDLPLRARFDVETAWEAEEAAKTNCPPTHRAADDVRHLLEIFRLAAAATGDR